MKGYSKKTTLAVTIIALYKEEKQAGRQYNTAIRNRYVRVSPKLSE
jgi:hypothetical protein